MYLSGTESSEPVINLRTRQSLMHVLRHSYIPGWDCHGLPIENKTLKELGVCIPGKLVRDVDEICGNRKKLSVWMPLRYAPPPN